MSAKVNSVNKIGKCSYEWNIYNMNIYLFCLNGHMKWNDAIFISHLYHFIFEFLEIEHFRFGLRTFKIFCILCHIMHKFPEIYII